MVVASGWVHPTKGVISYSFLLLKELNAKVRKVVDITKLL